MHQRRAISLWVVAVFGGTETLWSLMGLDIHSQLSLWSELQPCGWFALCIPTRRGGYSAQIFIEIWSWIIRNRQLQILWKAICSRSRWDNHNWRTWQHEKSEGSNNRRIASKHRSLSQGELTTLRSITGSLSWIARQGRPDLGYSVSHLQSDVSHWPTRMQMRWSCDFPWITWNGKRLRFSEWPMQVSPMRPTTSRSREDSTSWSTSMRRRIQRTLCIWFYHSRLAPRQFVECADLRCRRKPTHYNMVSKLVTNSEEWSLSWRGRYGADSNGKMVRGCAFHTSPSQTLEVLLTTLPPRFRLACKTNVWASNWLPSTTICGVTVRRPGTLWRMEETAWNGSLRPRWFRTVSPSLWSQTSCCECWRRTCIECRNMHSPNARLWP